MARLPKRAKWLFWEVGFQTVATTLEELDAILETDRAGESRALVGKR